MGIFSTNRNGSVSGVCLEADNNYNGLLGLKEAELDQVHNDQVLFEALIGADFVAVSEGTSILNEGTLKDVWAKVKAFLKKIVEKIKGVINSIIATLSGKFGKNNEEFVKKYKGEVLKKDLSKLKYKWIKDKGLDGTSGLAGAISLIGKRSIDAIKTLVNGKSTIEELKKYEEYISEGEYAERVRASVVGSKCSADEFKKELNEKYLDDVEEEEGLDSARLSEIMKTLCDKDKQKELEKAKSEFDKFYTAALKEIDTAEKNALKLVGDKSHEDQDGAVLEHKKASLISRSFSINQSVQSAALSGWVECYKKLIANRRAVFAKAAAYRKGLKEEAFLDAVEETAAFDMEDFNF